MKLNLKLKILNDVSETFSLQKQLGISRRLFYLAVLCSVFFAFWQLQVVVLLNPLIGGIISSDFSSVHKTFFFPLLKKLLGKDISGNGPLLICLSICIYAITLVRAFFQYLSSVLTGRYSYQIARGLRQIIFQRYLDFGKAYFDKRNVGELITVMASSVSAFSNQMNQLQGLFVSLLLVCVYFGLLLQTSWRMTLVVCIVIPIFNRVTVKVGTKIRKIARSQVAAEKNLGAKLHEVLSGLVIVKGFNKEKDEMESFNYNSQQELKLQWTNLKWEALLSPLQEISSMTTLLIVAFTISHLNVLEEAGAAKLLVSFYIVQQLIPTFNRLQLYRIEFYKSTSWNLELKQIFRDIEKYKVYEGTQKLNSFEKEIVIKNLNFCYLPDRPVINQFSCVLPRGKKIALVGPSGAGKTTLMNIVLRLYDCPKGSILIDGTDIREFTISSIRHKMAFVSQDVFLFDAPVMYNLTYGLKGKVVKERVVEVANQTRIHEFVNSLPEGYNSIVGERGVKLSGGQKQRIALARALLREAEIILLDEPTSALDTKTEGEIVDAIRSSLTGKTVVTIAHRLSTIQDADLILFMCKGKLEGQGKFSELLSTNPLFSEFVGQEFKKSA